MVYKTLKNRKKKIDKGTKQVTNPTTNKQKVQIDPCSKIRKGFKLNPKTGSCVQQR